ncbi:MAG: hypothetical protein OXC26_08565 [Albidovulum sp.]|nr:hypothetical protein [Albidovulum sp.]
MTIPTPIVKDFELDTEIVAELEISLSAGRLGTYLKATGGDRTDAVRLYTWNTSISAAFYMDRCKLWRLRSETQ